MKLFKNLRRVARDESGAVTVDWVVLTAAVVILAVGAIFTLGDSIETLVSDTALELNFASLSATAESN